MPTLAPHWLHEKGRFRPWFRISGDASPALKDAAESVALKLAVRWARLTPAERTLVRSLAVELDKGWDHNARTIPPNAPHPKLRVVHRGKRRFTVPERDGYVRSTIHTDVVGRRGIGIQAGLPSLGKGAR